MIEAITDESYADPFLRIIHISDLHIIAPSFIRPDGGLRARILNKIGKYVTTKRYEDKLIEMWERGVAKSNLNIVDKFEEFLKDLHNYDQDIGNDIDTWLVDTGDLSTWGDFDSILLGKDYFNRFATAANASNVLQIFGNHDAWPGKAPFYSNPAEIDTHKNVLRDIHFPDDFPRDPLEKDVPGTNMKVQLYTLNSIIHDIKYNSSALGEIKDDKYWKRKRRTPVRDRQLTNLASFTNRYQGDYSSRHLKMLATHHPIHYPGKEPYFSMKLRNAKNVANSLASGIKNSRRPLAHVVMSGHTHALYPPFGELPNNMQLCKHNPLCVDQCQLVIGTLSQEDPTGIRYDFPFQAQILELCTVNEAPGMIALKRYLAAWTFKKNNFIFITVPTWPKRKCEIIHFSP